MTLDANPVLRAAYDFWCSLPRPLGLPDIRQLDAAAIPRNVLPHLIVAETTGADFNLGRLRLAGAEIMRDLLAELLQHRRPVFCRSFYTLPGLTAGDPPNTVTAERLVLPLADGSHALGCVMVAETLSASDFRAGPLRILPPEPGIEVRHGPFELPS